VTQQKTDYDEVDKMDPRKLISSW